MVDSAARPVAGLQRLHLQLRRAPARAGRARLPLLLDLGHRGDPQGVSPLGHRLRRAVPRHVRLRHLPSATAGAWCWRAIGWGSSRSTWRAPPAGCASPRRCRRCWPAGDVDTSIDRVALHHYLSFHSVVPAPHTILNGVRKLPPATVVVVEPDGREHAQVYWRPRFVRPERRGGCRRLARRAAGSAAQGGQAPDGGRRAHRRAAVGRPRFQPAGGAAGAGGADGATNLQHRVRGGRRPVRRRVRLLRPGRQEVRDQPPADPDRQRAPADRSRRRADGDERTDDQPRRGRLLPAVARGRPARQGRAVRPGRRRDLRRLRLVPAAGRRAAGERAGRVRGRLLRSRPRDDPGDPQPRVPAGRRREPAAGGGALRRARRRDDAGRGVAHRHDDHAGRRSGEARRQHDDGLGTGGARAVPGPRGRRAGRGVPARAQAGPRRQGRS